jgi:hypothetical protein
MAPMVTEPPAYRASSYSSIAAASSLCRQDQFSVDATLTPETASDFTP